MTTAMNPERETARRDYDDIPGTLVFDGRRSRVGYRLNKFLSSLNVEANRTRFLGDEDSYLKEFGVSDEQRRAVVLRDWSRLVELGGQIFYIGKLAHVAGLTTLQLCARQAGLSDEAYAEMMRSGGRRPDCSADIRLLDGVDG